MTALRLCFVTPEYPLTASFGGIATYTRDTARWLVARGHDVDVILVSRRMPPGLRMDGGVKVRVVGPQRIRPRRALRVAARITGARSLREAYAGWDLVEDSLGAWKAIRRLSALQPFDVIEVADTFGLGFWGAVAPWRRAPMLVRSHGYADPLLLGRTWPGIYAQQALERAALRRADFVLPVSVERVGHYRAVFGIPAERIGPLHSGIDMRRFAPRAERERADPLILYLGRVEARKGCATLMDALRMVHARAPRARIIFVGPVAGDMREAFAAFLLDAAPWASYAGPAAQEQVPGFLSRSDVIVLPSLMETLPRVLIEALAAGVPQVATRANGIPEIVENGVTGLLVDPLAADTLADAICCLCDDGPRRESMARESRKRALAKFDIDRLMPAQVDVYRALRAGRSPLEALPSPLA